LPALLTAEQADLTFADGELAGQKRQQHAVGLAVHRRRADTDLQPLAMLASKANLSGARLQMAVDNQILPAPLIKHGYSARVRPLGIPVAIARLVINSMSSRFSAMKATIGDRSSPPMDGRKRRIGASTGSHSWLIRMAAGL